MEQKYLLKSKLIKEATILKIGPKSKKLLELFANKELDNQQQDFIDSAIEADLVGSDSLTLASRLKCEYIIKSIFNELKLPIDIEATDNNLMIKK